ncbi:DUF6432 family protein [Candidatus Halobonum tyrrellensis]|uniref:MarR family transcriptional regulator n=1 Tax=Candidatus Halobonum tyrrellensis G22 TaxID=1324957 RepID=V4HIG9_9EURY|nr:DUF6432 family protein [Candidatus Halobonum tyrrellensis]ESP87719.1 hypothetical protein K933_12900 [Candidatus Halobonum tyrrellensis G22]
MKARPEFRDRAEVDVTVLDALVGRPDDGMTVLELRAHVDADIDDIEDALSNLKADGLIDVNDEGGTLRIYPADRVVPDPTEQPETERSVIDSIRDRLGL